jgi:hypothetical protein
MPGGAGTLACGQALSLSCRLQGGCGPYELYRIIQIFRRERKVPDANTTPHTFPISTHTIRLFGSR